LTGAAAIAGRSAEAEVELEAIQPGDVRINVLAFQAVRKTLVMLPEQRHVGGVVVRDDDGIVVDANVALQARQQ